MAHDAAATLELLRTAAPDVLTLDLQMPGTDGLELLQRITSERGTAVVVISGVTTLAAAMTLRALERGAVDFVLKFTPGAPVRRSSIKREILSKIKMAAVAPVAPRRERRAPTPVPRPAAVRRLRSPSAGRPAIAPVVIGASTGGLNAISELLEHLPHDFKTPCVIVQHLPATFTTPFASETSATAAE